MDSNYHKPSTKKRGRPTNKLSVRLFLLDPDNEITKVTKETCSRQAINQLMEKGYGPPQPEHCINIEKHKVEFSLELTNEEFKQKLVEIYPKLENACFVLMKAGKNNKLEEVDPGTCCFRCYTPKNISDSKRGQGRLYIRMIAENEITLQCTHGISLIERFRSRVGGSQLLFVPILPKPDPAVPASIGVGAASGSRNVVASVAMPTNRQLPISGNQGIGSRPLICTPRGTPTLGLSSSSIVVSQIESTLPVKNSGNMVAQSHLPLSAIVPQTASTQAVHSSGNMVTQSPLSLSTIVPQTASTPTVRSSGNMVAQSPLSLSAIVPQTTSTPTVHSSGNIVTQSDLPLSAVVPQTALTPAVHSSGNMVTQSPLPLSAIVLQTASTPPLQNSGNIVRQSRLSMLASVSQTASSQPDKGHLQTTVSGTMAHQGQFPRSVRVPELREPIFFTSSEVTSLSDAESDLVEYVASNDLPFTEDVNSIGNLDINLFQDAGLQMPNTVMHDPGTVQSAIVTPPPIRFDDVTAFGPWVKPPQSHGLADTSNEARRQLEMDWQTGNANSSNVQISLQCTHGISLIERLRSTVGGSQLLYVPIVPKPAPAVPASVGVGAESASTNVVTSVAMPTNRQLPISGNQVIGSRPFVCTPRVAPSPSLTASTPTVHSSGNMVTQSDLPLSAVVPQTALTPAVHSLGNMVSQSSLPLSAIVLQTASTPPLQNSGNIVRQSQLSTLASVSQTASSQPDKDHLQTTVSWTMAHQGQFPRSVPELREPIFDTPSEVTSLSDAPSTAEEFDHAEEIDKLLALLDLPITEDVNSTENLNTDMVQDAGFQMPNTVMHDPSTVPSFPPLISSDDVTAFDPWVKPPQSPGLTDTSNEARRQLEVDWQTGNANSSNVQTASSQPDKGPLQTTVSGTMAHQGQFSRLVRVREASEPIFDTASEITSLSHGPFTADEYEYDLEEIMATLTDSPITDTGEDLNMNMLQEKDAGFQLPNDVMRALHDPSTVSSLIVTPSPIPSSGLAAINPWVNPPQSPSLGVLADTSNEVQLGLEIGCLTSNANSSIVQTASSQPDKGPLQTTVSGTMAHQGQFSRLVRVREASEPIFDTASEITSLSHGPFTADEFDLEEIIPTLTDSPITDTGEDLNMNMFQEKDAGFQWPNYVIRALHDPSTVSSLIVTPSPIPSSGLAAINPWVNPPQSPSLGVLADTSNEVQLGLEIGCLTSNANSSIVQAWLPGNKVDGADSSKNVVTSVAMPTNRQLPLSDNIIESRQCLSSSSIVVSLTESTSPVQNSGNMVAQRPLLSSTSTSVNESRLPACSPGNSTAQRPSPASFGFAASNPWLNSSVDVMTDMSDEMQVELPHGDWPTSNANSSNVQADLDLPEAEKLRIDRFLENVESTKKLELSLEVLGNDALLKKLNESTIDVHTIEIKSTCEVHQVLRNYSLPSRLEVLRINENNLNSEDISALVRSVSSVNSLHEFDLSHTKFKESIFIAFIWGVLTNCKYLRTLCLTDNGLTKEEITNFITTFKFMKNVKNLNLSKSNLTEKQANDILQTHGQAENIVSLDLSQNTIQGNEIIIGICQLQSLEELNLSHNYIKFFPSPHLEEKRDNFSKNTKIISLSSNHMTPDDICQFRSLIRSDLLTLNLDFNHVGDSIWSLGSLSLSIKHLKVLSLANTDICCAVGGLVFLLSSVGELEELNLSSNNLMLADFQQLYSPLSNLTQLKRLNLSNNPEGISALLQGILPSLKYLEELRLSNTHLNGDDLSEICDSLASLKGLKYLDLSMNAIGPDGVRALANIFKEFPLLEGLDMSRSCIKEDDISALCKGLVPLKELKYLNLSGNRINIEILGDVLFLSPTLEELIFSDITRGEKLFKFAKMIPLQNLKKLQLSKLKLRACDVEALAAMLLSFPNLEELSLAHIVVQDLKCEKILSAIKSLTKIKMIDLSGITLPDDEALADMLRPLSSLKELVLTDMMVANIDYNGLFSAIKLLKQLRKLNLGGVKVRDEKALFDMLSSLSRLEEIVFPDVVLMNTDCVAGSFRALESLRYLKNLDLRWTRIRKPAAAVLARVLPSLQLLEKLALGRIEFDDGCEDQLFAALGKLIYLKELTLDRTEFTQTGEEALAKVLPSLQFLEKLVLRLLDLDNGSEKQLFAALGKLKYLRELTLNGNTTTETGAKALAEVLNSSLQMLEKLMFDNDNECQKQLFLAVGKLKYLKQLDLIFIDITETGTKALAKVLPTLQLEKLLHVIIAPGNECANQLFVALRKMKYLKELYLNMAGNTQTDEEALARLLPSLRLLEKLTLCVGCFGYNGCEKHLFASLATLRYLKELDLMADEISQICVEGLAKVLPSLQLLENVRLVTTEVGNESLKQLFAELGKLKHLKKLSLSLADIAQTDVEALAEMLQSLQLLEILELGRIECDNETEKRLFAALTNLKCLKELTLRKTLSTQTSVAALAAALPSLLLLEKLRLCFMDFENESDKQLFTKVRSLSFLQELSLSGTVITQTGATTLTDVLGRLHNLKRFQLPDEIESDENETLRRKLKEEAARLVPGLSIE